MKRNTRNLSIRSETVRALRTLDDVQLVYVAGAAVDGNTQSGANCPLQGRRISRLDND